MQLLNSAHDVSVMVELAHGPQDGFQGLVTGLQLRVQHRAYKVLHTAERRRRQIFDRTQGKGRQCGRGREGVRALAVKHWHKWHTPELCQQPIFALELFKGFE